MRLSRWTGSVIATYPSGVAPKRCGKTAAAERYGSIEIVLEGKVVEKLVRISASMSSGY
jgi:hypothetical protein